MDKPSESHHRQTLDKIVQRKIYYRACGELIFLVQDGMKKNIKRIEELEDFIIIWKTLEGN